MNIGLNHFIVLSALLFAIGFFGVLLRKNTLVIYMCLELMLVAATLALVAFSRFNGTLDGNVFVFFILTVAAAEDKLQCDRGESGAGGGRQDRRKRALTAQEERNQRGRA